MTKEADCCAHVHAVEKSAEFDPNTLMEQYMNMRRSFQNNFGSFHPNDLVKTIIGYFKRGDGQEDPDSLWGLSVYNPNENVGQYMSHLKTPGSLGPMTNMQNSRKTNEFDPSSLNQRLMQPQQRVLMMSPSSNKQQTANQVSPGFDPDAINRKLMQDVLNKPTDVDGFGFGQTDTTNPNKAHAGNGAKQDAGHTGYGSLKQDDTSGLTAYTNGGFNPDVINAKLLSSVKYNPGQPLNNMIGLPGLNGGTSTAAPNIDESGAKFEYVEHVKPSAETDQAKQNAGTSSANMPGHNPTSQTELKGSGNEMTKVGGAVIQNSVDLHGEGNLSGAQGVEFNGQATKAFGQGANLDGYINQPGGQAGLMQEKGNAGSFSGLQNIVSVIGHNKNPVFSAGTGQFQMTGKTVGSGQTNGIAFTGGSGRFQVGQQTGGSGQTYTDGIGQFQVGEKTDESGQTTDIAYTGGNTEVGENTGSQSQGTGIPPGIMTGVKLQQTAPKEAVANGIGGLG